MKRVRKSTEPPTLTRFRVARPNATWAEMRGDAHFGGMAAYDAVRDVACYDQGSICAYCETELDHANPLRIRVEHFHSKGGSQVSTTNWTLLWPNMLAVCLGGGNTAMGAPFFAPPLPENLSCDAHKAHLEHIGKLNIPCAGEVLNPLDVPAYPSLFKYVHSLGALEPDPLGCAATVIAGNACASTAELVKNTIEVFNLNCPRLCDERQRISRAIEGNKKAARDEGLSPGAGLARIAQRKFTRRFPPFFTTIRACLGRAGEEYLQGVQYDG